MKKYLLTFLLTICYTLSFAQLQNTESEKTKPMLNKEIVRKVSSIDIEGSLYENVEVTIKSMNGFTIYDIDRVKVTIRNEEGKKIWKKTLSNAYMYVFRNGQVQVGQPNFNQLVIYKSIKDNKFIGIIREKEGVYY